MMIYGGIRSEANLSGSDSPESHECSVCFADIEKDERVITLACQHLYHFDCLGPMIIRCPKCNYAISDRIKVYPLNEIQIVIDELFKRILNLVHVSLFQKRNWNLEQKAVIKSIEEEFSLERYVRPPSSINVYSVIEHLVSLAKGEPNNVIYLVSLRVAQSPDFLEEVRIITEELKLIAEWDFGRQGSQGKIEDVLNRHTQYVIEEFKRFYSEKPVDLDEKDPIKSCQQKIDGYLRERRSDLKGQLRKYFLLLRECVFNYPDVIQIFEKRKEQALELQKVEDVREREVFCSSGLIRRVSYLARCSSEQQRQLNSLSEARDAQLILKVFKFALPCLCLIGIGILYYQICEKSLRNVV